MSAASARLVEQRMRNRVIQYLEFAASLEGQLQYAKAVPNVNVPYEVINQWQDWMAVDPNMNPHPSKVYSTQEWEALKSFQRVWEGAAEALPNDYPRLEDVQALSIWSNLQVGAQTALEIFAQRGLFPDDREVDWPAT